MNPWQQPPGQPSWGQPPITYGAPCAPPPPQRAGGGTAITAVVLSLLGGAVLLLGAAGAGIGGAMLVADTASDAQELVLCITLGLASLGLSITLLVGGIMLARRRLGGRSVIATACTLLILAGIIAFVVEILMFGSLVEILPTATWLLLNFVPPVATMVFALAPSTRQWCLAKQPPPAAPPASPWPPTYPGYPR